MVKEESSRVSNLVAKVNREMLESTRYSQIDEIKWSAQVDVVVVSMTNGNIMCFNRDGEHVRLISEKLYNQAILANRLNFQEEQDFSHPVVLSSDSYRPLNRCHFTGTNLHIFTGFHLFTYLCTTKEIPQPELSPATLQPYLDYPLVTNNQRILLEDSLFLHPARLFVNFLTNHRNQTSYSLFTSCLYLLHVHEPVLAFNLIRYTCTKQ